MDEKEQTGQWEATDWPQMALATVASENRPGPMTSTKLKSLIPSGPSPSLSDRPLNASTTRSVILLPLVSSLLTVNCPLFQALVILSLPPSSEPCHASALSDHSPVFCCSPHPRVLPGHNLHYIQSTPSPTNYKDPVQKKYPRAFPLPPPSNCQVRSFPSPPLTAMSVPCAA